MPDFGAKQNSVGQRLRYDRPTLFAVRGGNFGTVAQEMQKGIAGSRLETFEDAGHALFVDDAVRFNALLGGFLRSLAPAP